MDIIFILTILGVTAYLIYAYYRQHEARSNRDFQISFAKTEYDTARRNTLVAKEDLIKSIASVYGQTDAERVSNGKIWVGMNSDLLVASWGRAVEIKDNYVRGVRIEKWYYNPYLNRLNNLKFKLEITVEDNQVAGWKDLV